MNTDPLWYLVRNGEVERKVRAPDVRAAEGLLSPVRGEIVVSAASYAVGRPHPALFRGAGGLCAYCTRDIDDPTTAINGRHPECHAAYRAAVRRRIEERTAARKALANEIRSRSRFKTPNNPLHRATG